METTQSGCEVKGWDGVQAGKGRERCGFEALGVEGMDGVRGLFGVNFCNCGYPNLVSNPSEIPHALALAGHTPKLFALPRLRGVP